MLDLSPQGLTGATVESLLEQAGITANKNPIPFDQPKPADWAGLRLGSSAATTRGMTEADFGALGRVIAALILAAERGAPDQALAAARETCTALCARYPV